MKIQKMKIQTLTATALIAALVFIVTYTVRIPIPFVSGGYLNLGDTVIYIGGMFLGGWSGALAAGIGSALSDLLAGYVIYAPATFIIKGVMGFVCGTMMKRVGFSTFVPASVISGVIMVSGYFVFEALFFNFHQAIVSVPFNAIQFVGSIVVSFALFPAVSRIDKRVNL